VAGTQNCGPSQGQGFVKPDGFDTTAITDRAHTEQTEHGESTGRAQRHSPETEHRGIAQTEHRQSRQITGTPGSTCQHQPVLLQPAQAACCVQLGDCLRLTLLLSLSSPEVAGACGWGVHCSVAILRLSGQRTRYVCVSVYVCDPNVKRLPGGALALA
jgi:hypothetical protein